MNFTYFLGENIFKIMKYYFILYTKEQWYSQDEFGRAGRDLAVGR